jgi:hypothetical protein
MNDDRGLNGLADECHEMARSKGFWDPSTGNNVGEMLMMVVGELSEAHEEYRAGYALGLIEYEHTDKLTGETTRDRNSFTGQDEEPAKPVGFPIEVADALIRTLDLVGGLGIDIEAAVREKMDFNATRPHMHGKIV